MDDILFTTMQHIGVITLNRPKALHALTFAMIKALTTQLQRWQDDHDVHAIVIRAAGSKAFCAGGDVRAIYDLGRHDVAKALDFFHHEYQLNQQIFNYPKPYIALMDGITMGGGVGISLHGSYPVASENFVFAMPETSIGFFPDVGASYLLSRCVDNVGIYLGLTGNRIAVADALELGLIKYIIPQERHDALLFKLSAADLSTDAHTRVGALLQEMSEPCALTQQIGYLAYTRQCFDYQDLAAIFAALAQGNTIWHSEVSQQLLQKSPLSLHVTLKQLHSAQNMNLSECLSMDYKLAKHFMLGHDFYEGVRALLIDKDKTPHWDPAVWTDVTTAMVHNYFGIY